MADAVEQRAFRQDRFSFSLRESEIRDSEAPCSRLVVVRGQLPEPSGAEECVAVSAGGKGPKFHFSKPIYAYLQQLGATETPVSCHDPLKFVARFEGKPVYAVRAREKDNARALRVVRQASAELFDTAWQHGFRRIKMQVLASGGSSEALKPHRKRPFRPMFSFVESVRAFAEWCRARPERKLELSIYVVDSSIYLEIIRRRLDVDELLSSCDLRFWAKVIYPDGKVQRRMCQELEDVPIGELAQGLGLDQEHWSVTSIPQIGSADDADATPVSAVSREPLSSRVIPGGTLRFKIRP
jgi:hypothetical protein